MRRSAEEIDLEIIDVAAALFAAQGFDRTSVQQIADAVGYSKTGLLHRFPSKQAILDAVDSLLADAVGEIHAFGSSLPVGPEREHRVLTMIADSAVRFPGVVQYMMQDVNRLEPGSDPVNSRMKAFGDRVVDSLCGTGTSADDLPAERLFRVILALELICSGVVAARHEELRDLPRPLGPLLVTIAEGVIGAAAPASHPNRRLVRQRH